MKDQILKIAKVKSEKEFYKKYPTEEAFMAKHGKALKKAAMGTKMVNKQLKQLTDFGNPPIAQNGFNFADALQNEQINLAKSQQETPPEKESTLTSILNAGKQLGGMLSEASSEEMRRGGYLPMAQGGGMFDIANAIGGAFTKPGTNGGKATGGLGDTMQSMFGGDPSAFGKANPAGAFGKGGVGTGAGNFGKGMASGAGAAGIGLLNAAPQILEGIGQMKEQKKAIQKADQMSQISGLTAQAAESRPERIKNQYARPEDQMIQGLNPQGGGTNFLAAYGASIGGNPTEIQNMYNPGDLYSDLGYEPLNDSNVKQFQRGGKVKFDPSTYKSRPEAESSDMRSSSNLLLSAGDRGANSNDFSNYSTTINKYANMGNDTSYMSTRNTPAGTEEFFHNTNQGNPISQLRRGKEFINLSPEQVNSYKQKVLTGTGGFEYGGNLPTAEFGDYFQNSGQASIGKGAGTAIGSAFFGPVGGMVGGFLGGVAGNLLGGADDANKLANFETTTKQNTERAALQQGAQAMQSQYKSYMEDGGWVSNEWQPQTITKFGEYDVKDLLAPPYDADMLRAGGSIGSGYYTPPSSRALQTYEYGGQMAMGGDLEVHRGKAEPISYNPFLPDNGETVMFKGPSHDNGGMPISYGQNGVEVEGGEPAVKLADGGSPDGNLVVFGNMKIDDMAANHIGVEASKGKKYKRFINDLSKFESRQNKVVEKGTQLVNDSDTNDPFDQLAMNSGRAMMMGGNAKLLNSAIIKERAAGVQNAILDTAKEYGIKSDEIAQGKFVIDKNSDMAKNGKQLKKAQDGGKSTYQLNGRYLDPKDPKDAALIKQNMDDVAKDSKSIKDYFEKKYGKIKDSKIKPNLDKSIVGRTALSAPNAPQQMTRTSPEVAAYRKPFAGSSNYFDKPTVSGFTPPNFGGVSRPSTVPYNAAQPQFTRNFKTYSAYAEPSSFGGSSNYVNAPIASGFTAPNFGGTSRPSIVPYNEAQPEFMQRLKTPSAPQTFSGNPMGAFSQDDYSPEESKDKFDWKGLAEGVTSNLGSLFRPSNQEGLDPNQLYPEMFALASNQLEPVNAQQYNPRLKQAYDISLQDQLNEVDSQVRAATKMIGSNPAAAAQIFAQAADAKNKIRGEQFRMNQANQVGTQNANIDTLNQAQMQNLQLLDQQYVRQSQAKSNTKAQTLEALKSIASKTAQNKLENRQLGIMENMYNFRFGPNGQAYNVNNPYQFNNPTVGSTANTSGQSNIIEIQGKKYRPIDYDNKTNQPTKFELVGKNGAKIKARNGSIVKALKSL